MSAADIPQLLALRPDNIPSALRERARWAPWRAEWNAKRGKYDKIPVHPAGYGLSTKRPEAWVSFDQALAAYQANPKGLAGIGYLMTGDAGVVGIDLDHCVSGNTIAPWAEEILDGLDSYTELSPGGEGLRVFAQGATDADWTNHETGIEVYAGHTPRFLTVTGHRLERSALEVTEAGEGVLAGLAQRYARERESATVITLAMPDLVDELVLPDVAGLDLPYRTKDFLADGVTGDDRSRTLFAAAVDLFSAGLDEATVLSLLAANPHAMGIALDHRRQDHDRALMYLWVEHAQKARGRASPRVASVQDFEDLAAQGPAAGAGVAGMVQPDDKPLRFAFTQAGAYTQRQPIAWAVKGLLPLAELAVVFGESGAGKSFWTLDVVAAIARGVDWCGRRVTQAGVAYVCAEGAGGFAARLRAYAEFHGVDLAQVPLHVLADAPSLLDKTDVRDLVAALRALPALQVIVVDTLAQVTSGANENSGEDMGRAVAHCRAIHRATGAMVVLVAHAGKDTSKGIRGWSGIKGALDAEIHVERSGQHRAATVTKLKDGAGEGTELPFALDTVVLGTDEDGDEITSCVVKPAAAVARAARKQEPKGSVQRLAMRLAQGLLDLSGEVPVTRLIDAVVDEMPPPDAGKRDERRRHAMRAVEALTASGLMSVAGGVVQLGGGNAGA